GTINIAAKNNLILRTDTSLLTKKNIDVQTDIGNLYAKSLNVSSSEGKVSILGNGNVNLETQNDGWYTLKNRINAKNGIILGSKGENAITKINTVDLKSTDGNVLLLSGGDLTLDGNNGYTTGMKAAVASGFINAKDVTLWSKTGVLDISSGVINASNGGISIRAGNNAQVHDIDLNSTKNIEINSDKDLILERTNTRANQHIALSSKGNINAYQNYILDAKGVLSAISNGSIDGQGYGGAVIVEANQLSNNGIDFRATGSELLQLDTKLKNINGNLSIQLNKDFVIKPTHGHDTITLVAENDIDVRSKQGAIR
ncbi:hemagglutinin, partial [Acinetobacter baumannii]